MTIKVNEETVCGYRCDRGWLPTDGELDAQIDGYDGVVVYVRPLLWPTQWRPCFCSESDLLPKGVAV